MIKKLLVSALIAITVLANPVLVKAAVPETIDPNATFDLAALIAAQEAQVKAEEQARLLLEAQAKAAQEAQAQALAAAQAQALAAQQAAEAQIQAQLAAIQAATAAASQAAQQTVPLSSLNAAAMAKNYPDFVYVSISEQMAYMYRNGILVTSGPCVTGTVSKGYDTTVGFHQIIFMDRNRTLKGSYGTAFVKYWMRFTNGGQGLHDAGWRSKFGGEIYKNSGSHGCVNLQRDVAQTMYSYAYVGLPVIVVP